MWPRRFQLIRHLAPLALVAMAFVPLVAACDGDEPDTAPVPTRFRADPMSTMERPAGPASKPGESGQLAVATWTLPPDAVPGVAMPPIAAPTSLAEATQGQAPVPPIGSIPQPSAYPTQILGENGPPETDPVIEQLAAEVAPARLASDVRRLVGFGTRHARSDTSSKTRGIGAAREWLFDRFSELDGRGGRQVLVEFDTFGGGSSSGSSDNRNVVATLPGIGHSKRVIYVVAHYDSRTTNVNDSESDAPGADDNASGTAALLELCRVMSTRQWDATIRFVAFTAKETGLQGSRHHAAAAARVGLPLVAVFNNDIVGSASGPGGTSDTSTVRVFSAESSDGKSRGLARYVHHLGARYSSPGVIVVEEPDRPGQEGDHLPFSEAGFPAVRIIAGLEDPTRQNNSRDTADRLDADYLAAVVRTNLVAVANLALSPEAPEAPSLSSNQDAQDSVRVTWTQSDDPRVAGYFVAVRQDGRVSYSSVEWVGQAVEHVLSGVDPASVAVALVASDDMGHTSLFSPEAHTQ